MSAIPRDVKAHIARYGRWKATQCDFDAKYRWCGNVGTQVTIRRIAEDDHPQSLRDSSRRPASGDGLRPRPRGGGYMQILFMGMAESMGQSGEEGGLAGLYEVHAEHGDHRAIVGAQLEPRDAHLDSSPARRIRAASHAAASWRRTLRLRSESWNHTARTRAWPCGQNRGHGVSQRSAHVVNGNVPPRSLLFLNPPCDGGLDAGEAEIIRMRRTGLP